MKRFRSVSPPSSSSTEESESSITELASLSKKSLSSLAFQSHNNASTNNSNKNNNIKSNNHSVSDKSQSWRSTGWTPLAYPSSALYADPSSGTDQNNIIGSSGNGHDPFQLNPYFPLHKDVILAATRELLILDESIHSKTLEVVTSSTDASSLSNDKTKNKKGGNNHDRDNVKEANNQNKVRVQAIKTPGTKKKSKRRRVGKRKDTTGISNTNALVDTTNKSSASGCGKGRNRTTGGDDTTVTTNRHVSFIEQLRRIESLKKSTTSIALASTTSTSADEINEPLHKKIKLDSSHVVIVEEDESLKYKSPYKLYDQLSQHHKSSSGSLMRGVDDLSAEEIANMILHQCVWDADFTTTASTTNLVSNPIVDSQNNEDTNSNGNNNVPSFIRLSNNNDNNNNTSDETLSTNNVIDKVDSDKEKDNIIENSLHIVPKRPRKVSDVDDLTFVSTIPLSVEISPHLAVLALNMDDKCENLVDAVKNIIGGDDFSNQQSLIIEKKDALPDLLDISIMVESHLRRIAYHITDCLISHFHPKALREFLGYKSSALKKDRIMHLMSDYLFDVSHAMFAWDHTEAEIFGSEMEANRNGRSTSLSSSLDEKSSLMRDKKVCDSLFDRRALRKIGGFDSSSLLYHAVSMKRIRMKGESWSDLAKSSMGKKMLRHHWDDNARVQVGQLRRGQRIRKSRSIYYPMIMNERVGDGGVGIAIKTRSRSSSFASVESETTTKHNHDNSSVENSVYMEHINTIEVQSSMPDSLSISVTREDTSKSWGILLAKEGSMCVVMRVPSGDENIANTNASSNGAKLQRGDLIVSVRNERNEIVSTPSHSNIDETVSEDWFARAVGLFKRSCALHLNVTRVLSAPALH